MYHFYFMFLFSLIFISGFIDKTLLLQMKHLEVMEGVNLMYESSISLEMTQQETASKIRESKKYNYLSWQLQHQMEHLSKHTMGMPVVN